jgi:hypothetical protein
MVGVEKWLAARGENIIFGPKYRPVHPSLVTLYSLNSYKIIFLTREKYFITYKSSTTRDPPAPYLGQGFKTEKRYTKKPRQPPLPPQLDSLELIAAVSLIVRRYSRTVCGGYHFVPAGKIRAGNGARHWASAVNIQNRSSGA